MDMMNDSGIGNTGSNPDDENVSALISKIKDAFNSLGEMIDQLESSQSRDEQNEGQDESGELEEGIEAPAVEKKPVAIEEKKIVVGGKPPAYGKKPQGALMRNLFGGK